MIDRILRVAVAALIALIASKLPDARRAMIADVVGRDAMPAEGPELPKSPPDAAGLPPAAFVRVVLIDGVNREDALAMPAWSALCARGVDLELDVGFPTVSLPVQTSLWTGLTQQQTGVLMHSTGAPLADPLGRRGIPAQVPDAIAVAENHEEIIGSLGFASATPMIDQRPKPRGWRVVDKEAGVNLCASDDDPQPDDWGRVWLDQAKAAIAGPARLAFVHVLRVDATGHQCGRTSEAWRHATASADQILADLVATGDAVHPDARWFLLADHGHIASGGHGSEDPAIRRVRACIGGPGVADVAGVTSGGPIALVDLSRALADSLGVTLSPAAKGRPLAGALAAPLRGDELVPRIPAGRRWLAILILVFGMILTAVALGRHGLLWSPWWWPITLAIVLIALGTPDLSQAYVFAPKGDAIADPARWGSYLAAAWTAATVLLGGRAGCRAGLAQAAMPLACMAGALTMCGGLPLLWGDHAVAIAPRWTAFASVTMVITAQALWAVALALLATSVLPGSGRAARPGTRRSGS